MSDLVTDSAPASDAPDDGDQQPDAVAEAATDEAVTDEVLTEDELLGDTDAVAATDDEGDDEDVEPYDNPYDRPGAWYVVHTYAGYENKVKQNMASMVASLNLEDRVYEVVIPMEDVTDFKNGKRVVVQKKMFPCYLLVRVDMDESV